ncbi:MAG: hypothetical protein QGF67_05130, partial [Lentisphaeria bacterium]|nr:hypothetical protein [Lentisphaeria bacterium]
MKKELMIRFSFMMLVVFGFPAVIQADDELPPANEFLDLGTEEGLGGKDFMKFDRDQIKNQIKTFIPPLLRPAFTQHAFVLPPGLHSVAVSRRDLSIDGNDFFLDGDENTAVFGSSNVDRALTDLDIFYGFDFNREYLHGFTARVNIPYRDSQVTGFIHPGGVQAISAFNTGSTQELGDIGLFLKKKIMDQGNGPFGLAAVGAVFLPTGRNDEKVGNDGVVRMDTPAGTANSIFTRFSDDGRLPSTLQPGTGTLSYLTGAFLTRQYGAHDFLGRSALHLGITHRFVSEDDGIDFGDTTTWFASLVKPIYKDYLSTDLTFVAFDHQDDSYDGTTMDPVAGLIDRPSFSGGTSGYLAPSLIYSPDPQIRMTLSALIRVVDPDLGP